MDCESCGWGTLGLRVCERLRPKTDRRDRQWNRETGGRLAGGVLQLLLERGALSSCRLRAVFGLVLAKNGRRHGWRRVPQSWRDRMHAQTRRASAGADHPCGRARRSDHRPAGRRPDRRPALREEFSERIHLGPVQLDVPRELCDRRAPMEYEPAAPRL